MFLTAFSFYLFVTFPVSRLYFSLYIGIIFNSISVCSVALPPSYLFSCYWICLPSLCYRLASSLVYAFRTFPSACISRMHSLKCYRSNVLFPFILISGLFSNFSQSTFEIMYLWRLKDSSSDTFHPFILLIIFQICCIQSIHYLPSLVPIREISCHHHPKVKSVCFLRVIFP